MHRRPGQPGHPGAVRPVSRPGGDRGCLAGGDRGGGPPHGFLPEQGQGAQGDRRRPGLPARGIRSEDDGRAYGAARRGKKDGGGHPRRLFSGGRSSRGHARRPGLLPAGAYPFEGPGPDRGGPRRGGAGKKAVGVRHPAGLARSPDLRRTPAPVRRLRSFPGLPAKGGHAIRVWGVRFFADGPGNGRAAKKKGSRTPGGQEVVTTRRCASPRSGAFFQR